MIKIVEKSAGGVTGARIASGDADAHGPGHAVHGVLYGLHMARFTGRRLATAGTGGRFGHWLVDRLNIATIAGMPLAIAGLFWANRLLPIELPEIASWEVRCFLITGV